MALLKGVKPWVREGSEVSANKHIIIVRRQIRIGGKVTLTKHPVLFMKNERELKRLLAIDAILIPQLPGTECRVKVIDPARTEHIKMLDERIVNNEDVLTVHIRNALSRGTNMGSSDGKPCLAFDGALELTLPYVDAVDPVKIAQVFVDLEVEIFKVRILDDGAEVACTNVNHAHLCNGFETMMTRRVSFSSRSALVIAKYGINDSLLFQVEDELLKLNIEVGRVKGDGASRYVKDGLRDLSVESISEHFEKEKRQARVKGTVLKS